MSIFKKIFGNNSSSSTEEKDEDYNPFLPSENSMPVDEQFTHYFVRNGGKFLYCDDIADRNEQFENILAENDWFESEALCLEPKLFSMLEENKIDYKHPKNPKFLLVSCENLISDEGSILFSSNQIKQFKPNDLPSNIILVATTSQIIPTKTDGLREIKRRYNTDYPTNITTIKHFDVVKEESFLNYGSSPKNLYLLLLEDL